MNERKPKLLPVQVPWMVAFSSPFLRGHLTESGQPSAITFVGYFKLDHVRLPGTEAHFEMVKEPVKFEPARTDERCPYRLIRINFSGGRDIRTLPAFSDSQVIEESRYDWSGVPGDLLPGEDAMANHRRTDQYWLDTGTSPDPGVYEVEGSTWLAELSDDSDGLHHYMILGRDEYVEVLAEGWSWQAGQSVA